MWIIASLLYQIIVRKSVRGREEEEEEEEESFALGVKSSSEG